jgi:hypothetical protein
MGSALVPEYQKRRRRRRSYLLPGEDERGCRWGRQLAERTSAASTQRVADSPDL